MFIEGLGSATIVNGVMRIEGLRRNAKGEDIVEGEFCVPINRVSAVVAGLQVLLEKAEQASAPPVPVPSEVN